METTATVTQFIVDEFAPDIDASELDPDYDLLENGIVDSLGLLTILAWAEDQFGLTIDVGDIGEDDFRTVRAICSLIDGAVRAPQGTPG
jgi:D-alanine--poly(phosphoribitol) ligase subunit 2